MIPGGACASGTYADYVALGDAGCTIEGRLFSNFNSNATPTTMTITPNDSGSDAIVGFTFGALPITNGNPGLAYSVRVTDATLITRSGATFNLGPMNTGQARVTWTLGTSLVFPPTTAIEIPVFAAKTEVLPLEISSFQQGGVGNAAIIDTMPSDFSVLGFTNTFLNVPSDPQVIPEPGTLLCAGIGILLLCARRAMARGRC